MKKQGWHKFPEKNPIELWSDPPGFDPSFEQDTPTITPYLAEEKGRGCIIVFPGGGYTHKALHEAEPISLWLNSLGINSFVLDYRISPYLAPLPFVDAARAIRMVRARAEEWGIDPDKIGVLGFSAGGHLAACAATMYDDGNALSGDAIDRVSSRPDAAVLCYPAINLMEDNCLDASRRSLLGDGADDPEHRKAWSPDRHARAGMPPLFIWHTAEDGTVPFEQSLMMAEAAQKAGGRVELHVYPEGRHGLGLAHGLDAGRWTGACADFLKNLNF